jgi:type IV secretion system protein VirD4
VYTTAETVLEPFADPPDEVTGREPSHVDPLRLISESGTLYLCAPAHDQRRLRPLFTAVVRQIVEHAYEKVTRTGLPLDPPLLIVLDEAANIAPLEDLDTLASTAAGHGIQLVTIWQDLAQVTARYGPRAATVVNNHRAKVFLSGISDPSTLDHASHLIGDEELHLPATTSGGQGGPTTTRSPTTRRLAPPDALRRIAPGQGVLVYGGLPPARIVLRSWFEDPLLAERGIRVRKWAKRKR